MGGCVGMCVMEKPLRELHWRENSMPNQQGTFFFMLISRTTTVQVGHLQEALEERKGAFSSLAAK